MVKDGIGNYILASALFNRTTMIYMKTSVSRRLIYIKNIYIFIKIKIIAFFKISLFSQLYVSVGILLTCRKYLHDCSILQRWEVWAHKLV